MDYLILSQHASLLERFERDGAGWTLTTFGAAETAELAGLGLSLPIGEIYEDVLAPHG